MPALAVLVGFIPGCGPQLVVTSLYLSGSLPLSAQLGNAIANRRKDVDRIEQSRIEQLPQPEPETESLYIALRNARLRKQSA